MPSPPTQPGPLRHPEDLCALRMSCIGNGFRLATALALVAQLDRVLDYESRGRGFESSPARHRFTKH